MTGAVRVSVWAALFILTVAVVGLGYFSLSLADYVKNLREKIPDRDLTASIYDSDTRSKLALKASQDLWIKQTDLRVALEKKLEALRAEKSKAPEEPKIIEYDFKPEELKKLVSEELRLNDSHFREIIQDEMTRYEAECRELVRTELGKARKAGHATKPAPLSDEAIEEPAGEL